MHEMHPTYEELEREVKRLRLALERICDSSLSVQGPSEIWMVREIARAALADAATPEECQHLPDELFPDSCRLCGDEMPKGRNAATPAEQAP